MRLDMDIGKRKGPLAKLGRWAWVPLAPLSAVLALVFFLGVNRIGNDLEEEKIRALSEESRTDADEIYTDEPELYPVIWPADTPEERARMRERWEGELSRLEDNPEDAATAERLQEAVEKLPGRP